MIISEGDSKQEGLLSINNKNWGLATQQSLDPCICTVGLSSVMVNLKISLVDTLFNLVSPGSRCKRRVLTFPVTRPKVSEGLSVRDGSSMAISTHLTIWEVRAFSSVLQ